MMRFQAIATDFDRTLADAGIVAPETLDALRRFRASGRKTIMVTGRELDSLQAVFQDCKAFDLIVAEDGALLYDPATCAETPLCPLPPPTFVAGLRGLDIPFSIGRRIISSLRSYELQIEKLIDELGVDLHMTVNRESVMLLPKGLNKGTGLQAALLTLHLDAAHVVGIGDAENDHSFLRKCGFSVAVANAIPDLKRQADLVTQGSHGAGVTEVMDRILQTGTLP